MRVKVKPNARVALLRPLDDGSWYAQTRSPPADGKANDELIALVAAELGLRRSQVSIRRGASSRIKVLQIDD
jgi:uncharacterized protein